MKADAGRGRLYSAIKSARKRWRETAEVWQDANRQAFEDGTWVPLDRAVSEALEAMDQLTQLFERVRQECEGRDPGF